MKNKILILTNSEDGEHTEDVVGDLIRKGAAVFRLDVDRLANGEIKLAVEVAKEGRCSLIDNEQQCSLNTVQSIWYRRPNNFNFRISDTVQKEYADKEMKALLRSMYELVPRDVRWINHPLRLIGSRNKLAQIRFTTRAGIKVPATIVSNDPSKVLQF